MAYTNLALKYRPSTFDDMVGNENIAKILRNSVAQNKLAQSYFFSGGRGVGKTSSGRILAKAIQCENRSENGEPCGKCKSCIDILEGRHHDVIEIDAASENSVQGMRELIKTLSYVPVQSDYKIVIIDECHSLSSQAGNAILKTLEEPPPFVKFIWCTTEPQKVLDTIKSRSLVFTFKDIQLSDIIKRLRHIADNEGIDIDDKALEFIAKYSNGGMRDAVMLLDQSSLLFKGNTIKSQDVLSLVGFISTNDIQRFVSILKSGTEDELFDWLDNKKFSALDIIYSTINFLEVSIFIKQGASPAQFVSKDNISSLMAITSALSFTDIVLLFDELKKTLYDLKNLSIVNSSTVFRLSLLAIYSKLHNKAPEQVMVAKPQQTLFSKFKSKFDLQRVTLDSLLKA